VEIGSIGSISVASAAPTRLLYPEGEHAYQQLYSLQLTTALGAMRVVLNSTTPYRVVLKIDDSKERAHLQPVCSAMPLPASQRCNKWLPPFGMVGEGQSVNEPYTLRKTVRGYSEQLKLHRQRTC
jgi:hypothetical protein